MYTFTELSDTHSHLCGAHLAVGCSVCPGTSNRDVGVPLGLGRAGVGSSKLAAD